MFDSTMATKILVCLVTFVTVSAVPLMRNDLDNQSGIPYQCARSCKDNPSKFDYRPSQTYVYQYKAEADTSMAGASEETARMVIEAQANVEVIDTCEFALQLSNVKMYHSEPNSDSFKPAEQEQEFQRSLTESRIRFSFDDGIIRDICYPSQERIGVVNFKRGLLSAFQNSMDDLKKSQKVKEVDVTGECEAQYTKKSRGYWDYSIKVSKSKDLLACSKHDGFRTVVPMVTYKVPSDIQSMPIVKNTHECDYVISSSKILQSAVCKESHIFAPFSNHQSGASTKVRQTLTYKQTKSGAQTSQNFGEVRSNLLFQHVNGIDNVPNGQDAAENKLMEICLKTQNEMRPETPRLFSELVRIVKDLESSDLKSLYKMIKNQRLCSQNEKGMKFFLDSLPVALTAPAVEMMTTVINRDEIPDMEKHVWLTSLSLIREPSEDMLPSLAKLMNGQFGEQAMLPVSAVLNTMCEKNVDCENNPQFKKIVSRMNQNLDSSCSSEDRTQVLKTLRAVGNIGYGNAFLRSMKNCLKSDQVPLEVKVVVADAYRKFQCQDDEENGPLFQVFESSSTDPELRIMSFLSIMRCPRDSVLQKIAAQLDKEQHKDVGTFVYTHLQNLKQTSDPHKQDLAESVKRLNLKPFEESGWKTSRCFESSTLINRLNLGYVADGDLLWSENSVVPRAARLNLTLEMFGNSINVFEAGARVDGFDRFVQKTLGSEKYFSHDEASADDLEAFIYTRLFGNEVFFKNVKGSKEIEDIKSKMNLQTILDNLVKKFDVSYAHTQQLMDASLIIPTAIGLPVNLTMNATVSVDTSASADVDFSGFLKRSNPIKVTTNMAASAALEVTGSMMVDAYFYKQGLRMRNTLHSSVSFNSNLKIEDRQIVNFEVETPQEKQEIFDARSKFFIIHDNQEKEQEMIKENRVELNRCTGDKFAQVTGLELCGELQYPNASMKEDAPYFPFTGPAMVSLVMNKKDMHRSYKVFGKWLKNSKKLEAQFQLDTPGSQVSRHISADVTIGMHKNKHVDVVLLSPWKTLVVNGKATKNNDMASLTGSVKVDDGKLYKLTSQVKMSKNKNRQEYEPLVEIDDGWKKVTLLTGSAVYDKNKEVSTKLTLKNLVQNAISLESQVVYHKQEKRAVLSIGEEGERPFEVRIGTSIKQSGRKQQNVKVDPEFKVQTPKGTIVSLTSQVEFQPKPLKMIGDMTLEAMRIKKPIKFKVDVTQKRNSYPITVKLSSPLLSGALRGDVNVGKTVYKSNMVMDIKTDSQRHSLTWNGKLRDRSKPTYTQYDVNSDLKFKNNPEYNSFSKLKITHKNRDAKDKGKVELTTYYGRKRNDKNKVIQVTAAVESNIESITQSQIKANLKAKMPEKDVDIKMELDHTHKPRTLDSKIQLHLAPFVQDDIGAAINLQNKGRSLYAIKARGDLNVYGQRYQVDSDLTQKSKKRFEHTLTATTGDDSKHTVVTVYKQNKHNYEIKSDIESPELNRPLVLSVSASLKAPIDFQVTGALSGDMNDVYSIDVLSKLDDENAGRWHLKLAHPQRKVEGHLNFNNHGEKITTDASVNWDVNSKKTPAPEINVVGFLTHNRQFDSPSFKSNIRIQTPFKDFEKFVSSLDFGKSESEIKSTGKVAWGHRNREITTEMFAQLPISIDKAKLSVQAKTPFRGYEDAEFKFDHNVDSKIKTNLKAKLDKHEFQLIVKGNKDIGDFTRKVDADITLKTPLRFARRIAMRLEHSGDETMDHTVVNVDKDSEKYNADVKLWRNSDQSEFERSGKIVFSAPDQKAETSFMYRNENGKHEIETTFDASHKKKMINLEVTGSYLDMHHISLNVDMKSPWKSMKIAGLEIDHKIDDGEFSSKVVIVKNRAKTGYDIKLANKDSEVSVEILLHPSPVYENDIYLSSKAQHEFYPIAASTQISWSPSSVIDISGSYKGESVDDMGLNIKMTTPFEHFKNINAVASHGLKKSVRVSHLNIDYDLKTMIDLEVQSQFEELKKLIRIKMKAPCPLLESVDTGMIYDTRKGVYAKSHLEVELPSNEKYEGVVTMKANDEGHVKGKVQIKTPIEGFRKIEGNIGKKGHGNSETRSIKLTKDDESLIDVTTEMENKKRITSMKLTTKGKLLEQLAGIVDEVDVKMKRSSRRTLLGVIHYVFVEQLGKMGIFDELQQDRNGNVIKQLITQLKIEDGDQSVQVDGSVTVDYDKSQQQRSFSVRKTGDQLNNVDIVASLASNTKTAEGKIVLKLIDDIQVQATVSYPKEFPVKYGVEFHHSASSDKRDVKGNIFYGKIGKQESGFYLFISGIQHIELTATMKPGLKGSDVTSLKYRHEGQDNRVSCSLAVEDDEGPMTGVEMSAQSSPIHLVSLSVKTPIKDFKTLVITGDYDQAKFNGMIKLNDVKEISLYGSHDFDFKNPKFTVKTPLRQLQHLSVNVDGDISDGSSSFTLKLNDDDQIDGNVEIKYENPSQMEIIATMNSRNQDSDIKMKLEVEKADGKRTHFLLSLNDDNKIKYDMQQESGDFYEPKSQVVLELQYPSLDLQTKGLVLNLAGNKKQASGSIQVLGGSRKVFDADIAIDMKNNRKASLIVRQPKHMEYKFTQENFPVANENEIYFNWDKEDPDSSLVIRGAMKDNSYSQETDKSVSLKVTFPGRSVGVEYAIVATQRSLQSSGKIFWNDDKESQLSYELQTNQQDDLVKMLYDGELKVKLPTRTVGFKGSIVDQDEIEMESIFSWDMDNDASKKVGIKAKLGSKTHTQADVSIILPQNAHVESKLIMNKGDTILEGQTQIFYSDDSSKTLTLFSKVQNHPVSTSWFYASEDKSNNYSIQVGLSHPDSRIDVKMDSHWGVDDGRLTTSLGLDYLNARRQMKNMNLFVEINKLRKEINLYSTTPYKSVGFSGAIVSQDPLTLKATTTLDDVEKMSASLVVSPNEQKVFDLDLSTNGKGVNILAHHRTPVDRIFEVYQYNQHAKRNARQKVLYVIFSLLTPHMLETDLSWKPGMFKDARMALYDSLKLKAAELEQFLEEVAQDIETEITQKYKDTTASIFGDAKAIPDFLQQELNSIQRDLEKLQNNFKNSIDLQGIKIGDIDLNEEISRLQQKIHIYLKKLCKMTRQQFNDYKNVLQSVKDQLDAIKDYPIVREYKKTIDRWNTNGILEFISDIFKLIHDLSPEEYNKLWKFIDEIIEKLLNPQPLFDELNERMESLMDAQVSTPISKFLASDNQQAPKIKAALGKLWRAAMDHPTTDKLTQLFQDSSETSNDVYQLARWTYNYWDMEETIPRQMSALLQLVQEVTEEELKEELKEEVGSTYRSMINPTIHSDPDHGKLVAQFPMLVRWERFDKLPDVEEFANQIDNQATGEVGNVTPVTLRPQQPLLDTPWQKYPRQDMDRNEQETGKNDQTQGIVDNGVKYSNDDFDLIQNFESTFFG